MHQTMNATPPRHHGSIRRPRTATTTTTTATTNPRPDMPHLTTALSDTSSSNSTSSKSSPSRRHRPSDAKILRGAQILRQQLLQQHQQQQQQQDVVNRQQPPPPPPQRPYNPAPKLSYKDVPDVELSRSISSDEFSDPWSSNRDHRHNHNKSNMEGRRYSSESGLERMALRQKSKPWNRELKSKAPRSSAESGLKSQSWVKEELAKIHESVPVLVEPEQDESLAWDIDTPPVQSLESYSFPEHGDAGQWVDATNVPRAVSPVPQQHQQLDDNYQLGNVSRHSRNKQIAMPMDPLDSLSFSAASTEAASMERRTNPTHNRDLLQRARSMESSCSGISNDDGSKHTQTEDEARPLPIVTPTHRSSIKDFSSRKHNSNPPPNVVSPLSATYKLLVENDAYRHAMNAGYLWQTLVGQHVRFPSAWWKGARSPPMGMDEPYRWMYIARHRVQSNLSFNKLVRRRDSSGRLLLHIVVRDLVTWKPVQDIVIGCFHSNARGVRETEQALPQYEDCREIWMAVRKRCDEVSVVDCLLLAQGERLEECARESPLMGNRRHVTNVNIRAIFGDEPPKRTVCILESELYEQLVVASDQPQASSQRPPALLLLQEFFPDPDE